MERAAHAAFEATKRALPLVPMFLATHEYVVSASRCQGRSMQPTFNAEPDKPNVLLLNKLAGQRHWYSRGDVVVLHSPHAREELLTKRVVGLPGDLVTRRDGNGSSVLVPQGHLWVEGDNAEYSNDSNHFGPVAAGLVCARVDALLWPLSDFGRRVRSRPPPSGRVMTSRGHWSAQAPEH